MHCAIIHLLASALLSVSAGVLAAVENAPVRRDVVIIGAGAAGTYAATLLKSLGKTVAVIERKADFGGQTETYTVPGTNETIDFGVQGWVPLANGSYSVIQEFFATYDVPITFVTRSETGSVPTRYFDFDTATELTNFTVNTNLSAYTAQSDKYPWIGEETQTPVPLPSDLLLSFGDFLTKYSLQSEAYNIYYNVEGLGDTFSLPAYYVVRELNSAHLLALAPSSPGLVVTANHFNQQIYLRAQAALGTDAYINSTVNSAQRNSTGVTVTASTPSGVQTIYASKLLIAMPPTTSNLSPFGLDSTETNLFSKWQCSGWYAGLVNATGLPPDMGFQNAAADTPYNTPVLPALYQISPTAVADIFLVRYGADSPAGLSDDGIKRAMVETVEKVRKAVAVTTENLPPIQLLAYANHSPYDLHVSAADLDAGFPEQLAKIQGYRSTWYSSAAFFGSSSPDIWNATAGVVRSMLDT